MLLLTRGAGFRGIGVFAEAEVVRREVVAEAVLAGSCRGGGLARLQLLGRLREGEFMRLRFLLDDLLLKRWRRHNAGEDHVAPGHLGRVGEGSVGDDLCGKWVSTNQIR